MLLSTFLTVACYGIGRTSGANDSTVDPTTENAEMQRKSCEQESSLAERKYELCF